MAKPKADKPPPTQQALTPEEEAEVEARFREALKVALNTPARVADQAQTPKSLAKKNKES